MLMLVLMGLVLIGGQALAAGLEASVDRSRLAEGESILLTLAGPGDAGGVPDTAPLTRDFGVQSQGQGTSTVMTNGRVNTTREWRFLLTPKASGKLTVPALKLGDLTSAPIAIEVLPPSQAAQVGEAPAARLEAEVQPASVYVQGQTLYTLRILLRPQVQNASLEDPKAEGVQFERLGEDRITEAQRDGMRYRLIERRYALLPQRSGPVEIQAPLLSAAVPESRQRGGPGGPAPGPFGAGTSPFEHFFGRDPFAEMDGLFQRTKPIQVRGPTLTLDVKPQPAGSSSPWLPAESLQLAETWTPDPSQARVGEPITRTLAITAQGLSAAQLPDLTGAVPAGVKLYPDKPRTETKAEGDTLVAVKEIKLALVPAVAGRLSLPEVRLAWWDTRENREKVAVLPGRNLEVQPASDEVRATAGYPPLATSRVSPGPATNLPSPQSMPQDQPAAAGAQPAAPPATGTGPTTASSPLPSAVATVTTAWPWPAGLWPWLAATLGLLWLLTLGFWWGGRRPRPMRQSAPQPAPMAISSPNLAAALGRVRGACEASDPRAAREALLAWGQARWPADPPRRLEALAERLAAALGDQGLTQEADLLQYQTQVAASLRQLDQSLYAPAGAHWEGRSAWRALEPALRAAGQTGGGTGSGSGTSPLPALYPKAG